MKLSIIIPAINEEDRIGKTLDEYAKFFPRSEIVIVNNGSTDKTAEVIDHYQRLYPNIKVLTYPRRLGKGGAVYAGFRKARGNVLGFIDADSAAGPEEFSKLVDIVRGRVSDVAIGSRYADDAVLVTPRPLGRQIPSRLFNVFVGLVFGLNLADTQCGYKVMRREVFEEIQPELILTNFAFDVELLWRLSRRGVLVKEVGIQWEEQTGSSFKTVRSGLRSVISLLRIRYYA